jgi:hypothetical protein
LTLSSGEEWRDEQIVQRPTSLGGEYKNVTLTCGQSYELPKILEFFTHNTIAYAEKVIKTLVFEKIVNCFFSENW